MTSYYSRSSTPNVDRPSLRAQRGAAQLFITMILLVVIMMLGITATILSGTQFKLAGNLQFENNAFNQAEGAAAAALAWLATGTNAQNAGFTTYSSGTTPYLYPKVPPSGTTYPPNDPSAATWDDTTSLSVGDATKRYAIQQIATGNQLFGTAMNTGEPTMGPCPKQDLYRIFARGTSAKGTTKIVQTTVNVPNPDSCI